MNNQIVWQPPDDLVVHAGDDVAGMLHVERGAEAEGSDQAAQCGQHIEEAFLVAGVQHGINVYRRDGLLPESSEASRIGTPREGGEGGRVEFARPCPARL